MRYLCPLLIVGLFTAPVFSQRFSIGVKAGARLTDDLQTSGQRVSESKRYTVGPAVQLKLLTRLSLEFSALYKRVGTSSYYAMFGEQYRSRDRSNSWEFPILARYNLLRRFPTPYVSGGYAFRTISGSGTYETIGAFHPTPSVSNYSTHYRNSSGLVVGGGVEFNAWFLKISPEFRYTRWFNRAFSTSGSHGTYSESAQNQMEALVGFMSRGKIRGKP
jgi:opacity protein-like surface antigen